MSSDQHELSRQQGVVTPPRPLVQSARLLPPPPRDSTETNGGTEKLRVEEGDQEFRNDVDPTGPQVRRKQTESLGKHMDSLYSLLST
ncbi:Hypothetical protein SMAX5B_002021 [Scophthalmus maximus]|uniref:Uncharacterized protein n=1 Tax=Scophthalmus maximus TaxID=52904 RepID=A0A2U9BRJ3_SCOMX|nr:Hypothetical protein SMAX5B_002021 [Scophthalmus maximus]